ncbi:hypothetical protein, partial [uncultured Cardiobacterium sp.]|uniref:hypothetical protein n=1 Tax=uncultured Cardiobacterium sp. TaxID=417619 RepID=UPI002605CCFE
MKNPKKNNARRPNFSPWEKVGNALHNPLKTRRKNTPRIKNLSLLQRDCDLSALFSSISWDLLKTCPCLKGIATITPVRFYSFYLLKTCPCLKGIATIPLILF